MAQTTIQKNAAIRFGSGKLEVGDDLGSMVDIGAVREVVFTSKSEDSEIEFDNTLPIKRFKQGSRASVSFLMAEPDFTNLETFMDGLYVLSTVAGSLVSSASQVVASGAWGYNDPFLVENQNNDLGILTINSVTGGTDGLLVADTDYFVGQDSLGRTIITVIDSTTVTVEAQSITLDYDYTPAASKVLTPNEFGEKNTKFFRVTNTDSDGKDFIIDMNSVTNITPLSFPFTSDDGDDVMMVPVEADGILTTLTDEQSTA